MATELGKAYVQLVPSAKGISGKIRKELDPEATAAGNSAGGKIGGLIKKAVLAAGIGLAIKSAIDEGGKLQQSLGGVETLFKGSADMVKKHAAEAYRTAGLSANAYMENVTGFSASLLQSLGGDTQKAAKISNRAMIDMADNSNKMGTNMQDIQNAYQGFAKQNYTMLDNLKLGYGGTKTEMQRLLKDAQKLTGVKYNIDNLADVYTAVGVIQDQLGITGTTALEAEETITGSLSAMQASFKNLLGNLALGKDIGPSLKGLAKTVSTFLFGNLLPMVWNIVSKLPEMLITFVAIATPQLLKAGGDMIKSIVDGMSMSAPGFNTSLLSILDSAVLWIQESLPNFLNTGVDMISQFTNGILSSMPFVLETVGEVLNKMLIALFDGIPMLMQAGLDLIKSVAIGIRDNWPAIKESIVNVLSKLVGTILEKYPEYFKKGWEIIGELAKGLWDNLPFIISELVSLLDQLIRRISAHLPSFLAKGMQVIAEMAFGLVKATPGLIAKIPGIVGSILKGFGTLAGSMLNIGVDIIKGLWKGIGSVKDWLLKKISGFVDGVMGGIKKFFGIKSPSRIMADEVGKWLPPGLAVGIEGNTKPLLDTMEDLSMQTVDSFNLDPTLGRFNANDLDNTYGGVLQKLTETVDRLLNNPPQYQMVTDTGVLAGEMTPIINKNLQKEADNKQRGG